MLRRGLWTACLSYPVLGLTTQGSFIVDCYALLTAPEELRRLLWTACLSYPVRCRLALLGGAHRRRAAGAKFRSRSLRSCPKGTSFGRFRLDIRTP